MSEQTQSLATPAPAEAEAGHLLIEGELTGRFLDVAMPEGTHWAYLVPTAREKQRRTVLVHIDRAAPREARIFHPTAEGMHPFVGLAERLGVEGGRA